MKLLDLIEFYGTSPFDILQGIYDEMLESLRQELEKYTKREKNLMFPILENALHTNFEIFLNFATDKVLCFPKNFSYERKATYMRSDTNLTELKENINELIEDKKEYEDKKEELEVILAKLQQKNETYNELLKCKTGFHDIMESIKYMRNSIVEIENINFEKNMQVDPVIGELMDYQEVVEYIDDVHLEDLKCVGTVEDLKNLHQNLDK